MVYLHFLTVTVRGNKDDVSGYKSKRENCSEGHVIVAVLGCIRLAKDITSTFEQI